MKDKRAEAIIAQVAKSQIEQKFGSVAKAITKICRAKQDTPKEGEKMSTANAKAGINLWKAPIKVKHSELEREGDSIYKSTCPVCKDGMLLMQRNQGTFALLKEDICILCGQHFIYEEMPIEVKK